MNIVVSPAGFSRPSGCELSVAAGQSVPGERSRSGCSSGSSRSSSSRRRRRRRSSRSSSPRPRPRRRCGAPRSSRGSTWAARWSERALLRFRNPLLPDTCWSRYFFHVWEVFAWATRSWQAPASGKSAETGWGSALIQMELTIAS